MNRRQFTRTLTVAGLAGATLPGSAASGARVRGANERIRLGFIGLGNRGDQVLDAFLVHSDCEVVALCDLHAPYLDFAEAKVARGGGHPARFHDYRKLLELPDLDAVVVCTPDHWHALQSIHACQAGKDVYVEKPLSLCVAEGRRMVEAAHRHQRVVQVGIQRRSSPFAREAADFIRSGGLGQVTVARCFHVQNEWPSGIGRAADSEPPKDFDWDAWLGPAPRRAYNKNRTFYRFRWFRDYSGGQLTNFGVHYLSLIHWALGADAPRSVVAMGGKFADYDNREIPDTLEVVWHYPSDTLVTFSQFNATAAPPTARPCEIEFRGTKGTLYFNTNGYEVVPERISEDEFPARTPLTRSADGRYRVNAQPEIQARRVPGEMPDSDHTRNFLDCVRSRKACNCDLEFGHRATTAALIANIALQTRAQLDWDAAAERFTNHREANRRLSYAYRAPYRLPG